MACHIRKSHASHQAAATEILVLNSPREMARFSIAEMIPTLMKKNPQVAVNPAESNSSQKVSGEPATEGPNPAPLSETPAETEENPLPVPTTVDAI